MLQPSLKITLLLLIVTTIFRTIYYSVYLGRQKKINWEQALKNRNFNFNLNGYDDILSFLPFAWIWIDITIALFIASFFQNAIFWVILTFFTAGRFRALQELTHIGIHQGFCRLKNLITIQANIFFQYPLFKPDVYYRKKSHYRHHFTAYDSRDPNVQDFLSIGFIKGISMKKFIFSMFYPLTPLGVLSTVKTAYKNFFNNKSSHGFLLRLATIISTLTYFYVFAGSYGVVWGYLIPAFTIYPFLAWLAQLAEHRWFIPNTNVRDRVEYEYINGRPTDYPGLLGGIVRTWIFPFGDSYHLAHSLYINAHWLLLVNIDRELKKTEKKYMEFCSEGLFFSSTERPSALSELKQRLVV